MDNWFGIHVILLKEDKWSCQNRLCNTTSFQSLKITQEKIQFYHSFVCDYNSFECIKEFKEKISYSVAS